MEKSVRTSARKSPFGGKFDVGEIVIPGDSISDTALKGIQQNTLMCSDNTGEMDILRKRLLRFSYKIKIIQHYFYHCKDVNITRLFAKLLTRIWWIYHLSSPIMQ